MREISPSKQQMRWTVKEASFWIQGFDCIDLLSQKLRCEAETVRLNVQWVLNVFRAEESWLTQTSFTNFLR